MTELDDYYEMRTLEKYLQDRIAKVKWERDRKRLLRRVESLRREFDSLIFDIDRSFT